MKNSIVCLLEHIESHPELSAKDAVKFLYQSEFSTGHMTGPYTQKLIAEERESVKISNDIPLFECVGEKYARLNLNSREAFKVSDRVIAEAMKSCADIDFDCAVQSFLKKADETMKLIESGEIALNYGEFRAEIDNLKENGYCPVSHSEQYRLLYKPSYRLVPMWFKQYFEVIARIDAFVLSDKDAIVAIDGNSASGKSTLAENLSKLFDCNIFHMDDFFLQKSQRTPERFEEPGGNVDYERFYKEVFKPLVNKEDVIYRKFNCSEMELGDYERVEYKKLNIIEGAYSMRPEFKDGYALKIFLQIESERQKTRILHRNGGMMLQRFINEWIPLEEKYFTYFKVKENSDIVIRL